LYAQGLLHCIDDKSVMPFIGESVFVVGEVRAYQPDACHAAGRDDAEDGERGPRPVPATEEVTVTG
jgi:hypothetical protein